MYANERRTEVECGAPMKCANRNILQNIGFLSLQ